MENTKLLDINEIQTGFITEKKLIKILDGVTLNLTQGEILGVVGESGSGKSVTMLSALQLLPGSGRVTAGSVELDGSGENILSYKPTSTEMQKIRGGRIGMIFQEPMTSLNPVVPVGKQIQESIMLHLKMNKREAKARAIEMLKLVNIPDAEERYDYYPQQFSGGMRQRIMIAMVLAAEPDVLIADEATTALDVTSQAQILEMIKDLAQKTGTAVVIVTHNLGIVSRYADRVYVMYAGNVVETAETIELFTNPSHPYTRGLLKAIPRLDDPWDRVLVPIDGLPPMPADRPEHCPFYDRCLYRCERCKTLANPVLKEITPGHFIACHLKEDDVVEKKDEVTRAITRARPQKTISDEICLEVKNLKKSFAIYKGIMQRKTGSFNALEDISFFVRKGETLGIVGESGCGKTTLARSILRMYNIDAGSIEVFGNDIARLSGKELTPIRQKMSYVFQDPFSSLDPRLTAGDIIGEPLRIHKMVGSQAEYEDRVHELMRTVELDPDLANRFPHEFSGGQRQRIGIARALASNPSILLLDEPISALDVSIQAQIINLLEELQSKLGLAYLFIAHDLAVVKHISDRVLVMYLGRVMEVADGDKLYGDPLHPYTRALLSAVPIVDPVVERSRPFVGLRGEIPSVLNRPKGCPFSDRCEYAQDRCREEIPPLEEKKPGHLCACFLK